MSLKAAVAQQLQLIQAPILSLLVLDVLPNHLLIPTHRRDKVPSRPEVLTNEIPLSLPVYPGNMDSTLPLDVPYHLGYRILRWNA